MMNNCLLFVWIFVQHCHSLKTGDKECAVGCQTCFNGRCMGCKSEYYGEECTSRCNDKCLQDGSCQGKVCLNGCPPLHHGSGCSQTCFFCIHGCHRNGSCKRPKKACTENCAECYLTFCQHCKDGWFGHDCTSRCNDKCKKDGSCQGSRCYNGCPSGWYGSDCRNICSSWCSAGCHQLSGSCYYEPKNIDSKESDDASDSDDNSYQGSFPVLLKAVAVIASVMVIMCVVAVYCRNNKEETPRSSSRTVNYFESDASLRQPSPRSGTDTDMGGRGYRSGIFRPGEGGNPPRDEYTSSERRYDRHSPRNGRHSPRDRRHSPRDRRHDGYSSRERDGYGLRDSRSNLSLSGSINSGRSQGPHTFVIEEPVDLYPVPLPTRSPSAPSPPSPPSPPPPSPPPSPPTLPSYAQIHSLDNREPPPAYSSLFPGHT